MTDKNEELRKMLRWISEEERNRQKEEETKNPHYYSVTIRFTNGRESKGILPTNLGKNLFDTVEGKRFFTDPRNYEEPEKIASISITKTTKKTISYVWRGA